MYLSVLGPKQTKLLKKLGFLEKQGFYMAGGTALALQIGHRTSLDFDFYVNKKFDARKLKEEFDKKFNRVREIYISEDTMELDVEGLKMSFFKYPYKPIRMFQKINGINLASVEDIAAMKVLAISQRGKKRDFIDIYFLIRKFGLTEIMEFTKEKYSMFNTYVGLQGLTYFNEANEDPEKGRIKIFEKVKWDKIKNFILENVNRYKRFYLK